MHFSVGFVALPGPPRTYGLVSVTAYRAQAVQATAYQTRAVAVAYPKLNDEAAP